PAPTRALVQPSPDDDPSKGSPQAKVTIIEFSDFQCPFCARWFTDTYPQILRDYVDTGKARLVYRDLPLESIHPNALPAAEAAECADEQGKFWDYHDALFRNQGTWAGLPGAKDYFKQLAADQKLNAQTFAKCLDESKYREEVLNDLKDAQAAGATGTPAFYINGRKIDGAQPYAVFQRTIEEALKA
ncbi:MAG: DsbA family protein, partial [Euryarchaeota archaeon]|nr:DsbA family protein [Euryarchaeota archaeon]